MFIGFEKSYFEKNYRLIAADISKRKALDADSRAIQQVIFTGKIKSTAENTRVTICYILEQSKGTIPEFAKRTTKVNVKLTDTQLKKLKNALKDKTETTLRMGLKMLDWNYLPHELLLTTRQKTRLKNAFNNEISTDLKLCKAQISKII